MGILMLVIFEWEAKKVRASGVKSYPLYRKPQVFSQFIAAPDASQKACLTRQPLIRFSDRYRKRQCEQHILKFLHEQAVKKKKPTIARSSFDTHTIRFEIQSEE